MKFIFAEPRRTPAVGMLIAAGLFEMTLPWLFSIAHARALFACLGLPFILIGTAELVPTPWKLLAIALRIVAIVILGAAGYFALILLQSLYQPDHHFL